MYNKTVVVGNVGKPPEMRYTADGTPVTSFSLASTRRWNNADGSLGEDTTWFRVTAWRKLAETCNKYVHKGMRVLVEGAVKASAWMPKDSDEPRATLELTAREVQFLTSKAESDAMRSGQMHSDQNKAWDEEEIPF